VEKWSKWRSGASGEVEQVESKKKPALQRAFFCLVEFILAPH